MKQEEDNKKQNDKEEDSTFLSKVMDFFIKLMDKFTDGKYSTKEEQEFFADEKNLYDENGDITPEYQRKIDEFEEQVNAKSADDFLQEVHEKDSEELGEAYDESEKTILSSACDFITNQLDIVKALEEAKAEAIRNGRPFDFDNWMMEYIKLNNPTNEEITIAQKFFIESIEELDLDKNEAEVEAYQITIDESLNQKEV